MLTAYNSIVAKLNERSSNRFEQSFKTRYGIVVNLRDFASRMDSVLYKRWAAKSLEYLLEVYGKYTKSFHASIRGMTDFIPEDFIFHEDVFFYFAYSALDIVGGIIDTLVETAIDKRKVYFTTVLNFLASSRSPFAGSLIDELKKRDSDTGWIHEFRQYRIFVTHHSAIRPRSRFSHTASSETTEINHKLEYIQYLRNPLARSKWPSGVEA
ncbi:MAG: hypothetical protein ABSD49_09445 [Candidatus Bathyarchaeia archaeon]|jgi:hypothetical protein